MNVPTKKSLLPPKYLLGPDPQQTEPSESFAAPTKKKRKRAPEVQIDTQKAVTQIQYGRRMANIRLLTKDQKEMRRRIRVAITFVAGAAFLFFLIRLLSGND